MIKRKSPVGIILFGFLIMLITLPVIITAECQFDIQWASEYNCFSNDDFTGGVNTWAFILYDGAVGIVVEGRWNGEVIYYYEETESKMRQASMPEVIKEGYRYYQGDLILSRYACYGNNKYEICREPLCEPLTCSSQGYECGSYLDGCGETINCGTCGTGEACIEGECQISEKIWCCDDDDGDGYVGSNSPEFVTDCSLTSGDGGYETPCSQVSTCSGGGDINNPPICESEDNLLCDGTNKNSSEELALLFLINPGVIEICDGIDNNCNGIIDGIFVEGDVCCTPNCPDASTVQCGTPLTDTEDCGTGVCEQQNGTKCDPGQICDTDTWTCEEIETKTAQWRSDFSPNGDVYSGGEEISLQIDYDKIILSYYVGSPDVAVKFELYKTTGTDEVVNVMFRNKTGIVVSQINSDLEGYAEVSWTPTFEDRGNFSEGEEIYFRAIEVDSNEWNESKKIKLTLTESGTGIDSCYNFQDRISCESASQTIVEKTFDVSSGFDYSLCKTPFNAPSCGPLYYMNCRCEWEGSGDTEGTCGPAKDSVEIPCENPNLIFNGTCRLENQNPEDNCDDGIIMYSWNAVWNYFSSSKYTAQQKNDLIALDPSLSEDFIEKGSNEFYYDPVFIGGKRQSEEQCSSGENVIPCLSQLKLPFFGWFGFVVSLIVILGMYKILYKKE